MRLFAFGLVARCSAQGLIVVDQFASQHEAPLILGHSAMRKRSPGCDRGTPCKTILVQSPRWWSSGEEQSAESLTTRFPATLAISSSRTATYRNRSSRTDRPISRCKRVAKNFPALLDLRIVIVCASAFSIARPGCVPQ
jgi:hypothetical protein